MPPSQNKPAFGVGIPTGTEGLMYPAPFLKDIWDNINISVKAEQLGYQSVWGNDHVATQSYVAEEFEAPPNYYAPLITLAAVAAHTTTLGIATALLVLPFRHPGVLAKELASLDQLCRGRLKVAVGLGAYREEFENLFGRDAAGKNRGKMMDESLEIMRRLFNEDSVTYQGQYFEVDGLRSFPKPVSNPFPFYIGGNSDKGLDRVVKYGTGWLPSGLTALELKGRVAELSARLQAAGRSISEIDVAPQFSVSLGKTHEAAYAKYTASQQYQHMLSLSASTMQGLDLNECASRDLIGTPDEVAQRICYYMEAGATSFPALLFTAGTLSEFYEEMQWFAEEVIPRV